MLLIGFLREKAVLTGLTLELSGLEEHFELPLLFSICVLLAFDLITNPLLLFVVLVGVESLGNDI